MKSNKNELLSGLDDRHVSLIKRLFNTDIQEFCENLINLKHNEVLMSVPININYDQYLFIITKNEDTGDYNTKFCKGPSFNKPLKESKDCLSVFRIGKDNKLAGTISIKSFFNKCLMMDKKFYETYKSFKEFIKNDFLLSMIQDYVLDHEKEKKTLKKYIKFRMNKQMMSL